MPARVPSQQTATSTRLRAGINSQPQVSSAPEIDERDLNGTLGSISPAQLGWLQEVTLCTYIDLVQEASLGPRLQKESSNPSMNENSASFLPSTNGRTDNVESQNGPANRKRQFSIQNQKVPMGPRPLDASSGKRYEYTHDP
jgi:hypothetical protein